MRAALGRRVVAQAPLCRTPLYRAPPRPTTSRHDPPRHPLPGAHLRRGVTSIIGETPFGAPDTLKREGSQETAEVDDSIFLDEDAVDLGRVSQCW